MSAMLRNRLLAGKRILVTGGGTGLGKEISAEYLRLGAEVHICGRRGAVLQETAEELVAEHPGLVVPHICDIRNPEQVDAMLAEIERDSGLLTGLVNNAAGNILSPTQDLSIRAFEAVAGIVFHGSFNVTHALGKRWIATRSGGTVLSILVTWVWNGSPYTVPSAMSKAGVNIMTKSLAVEWAPFNIRLNAIAPGPFPTRGAWQRLRPGQAVDGSDEDLKVIPMGRVGKMEELRNLAAFLMGDGCDYLTGQCIAIDGGIHLANGGNYSHLASRSATEWDNIRKLAREASEKEKVLRDA